jgi:transcription termination factor NusB
MEYKKMCKSAIENSSEFLGKLTEELNETYNESVTENGAIGYKTSGKKLVDINFAVSSLRNKTEQEIIDSFMLAYYENPTLALKWLFYLRDVRYGLGERRSFRVIMKHLIEDDKASDTLLNFIPEYGRWDDLLYFIDTKYSAKILDFVKTKLSEDVANMGKNKNVSLLAKWLPSINTSSCETKRLAKKIKNFLNMSDKQYRKTLSALRSHMDVVEKKMSRNQWCEIQYDKVPSKANLLYRNAFLKHDKDRRELFLDALENGETKINASVLYPHEIVNSYTSDYFRAIKETDLTLESLWTALPNNVDDDGLTIVVADGSGSMTNTIGKTKVTALAVANSLAIYFAERSCGQFKNKYISFSENPQLVDLTNGKTLRDKIKIASKYNEVANTNIERVFDLILQTAVNNNMKQSDIPKNVLIVSDMEFDSAIDHSNRLTANKLFNIIECKYKEAGYSMPKLIFWNVMSRTNTIPIRKSDNGVFLVSGFSTNIMKSITSNVLDPYSCLLEILNSDRYKDIK